MSRGAKLLIGGLAAATVLVAAATVAGVVVRRALWWEPTAEQCLGFPLPAGSRVVAEIGYITHAGNRWFVIDMSRDQFDQFKAAGEFAHRPDLVSYWPSSLWPPNESMGAPSGFPWMAHPVNDECTVYREANDALDVARWEDGRLYFRHHIP